MRKSKLSEGLFSEKSLPPSFYLETLKEEHLKIEELAHALNGLATFTRVVYSAYQKDQELNKEAPLEEVFLSFAPILEILSYYAFDRKFNIQEAIEALKT